MPEYKYEIGGKWYVQRPLVMGQIRQLLGVLKQTGIPKTQNAVAIATMLGDRLPVALAIVIFEDGKTPRRSEEEIEQQAKDMEFDLSPETAIEVIGDFFDCNPVALLLEKLTETMTRASLTFTKASRMPSSSSAKETSPEETKSNGVTPSENASPGSSSA